VVLIFSERNIVMESAIKRSDKKWTYADYLTWDDGQRWELIKGEAYCMSPAPGRSHQYIQAALVSQIFSFLRGKPCDVYGSPFDVRLSEQTDASDNYVETVVQPDLLVVCDKTKLDERGCNGAPDLVVEIISPSTAKMDLTVKYGLYEKHGVKEYWIIHPAEHTLLVYKRSENGIFGAADRYAGDDHVPVPLLGDLVVDLAEVFSE
jgi:Uma2 family endonuclease